MDLELVKFINSDLSWNAVKKGHRTMMRRPKRPATSNSDFEYEKFGVAILGQHFGEEVVDVPIKKRILMNERTKSTQEHLIKSKKSYESKQVPDLNDFSGIQLLAAAACHSSASESPAPMESCAVEEHTTPRTESYPDGVKDDIAPIESDHSSVQDSLTQNLEGDKSPGPVPSKDVRFHWDLNTVMDEWEEQDQEQEPCCDILVDPHSEKGYELQKSESQQVKSGQEAVSEVVQDEKAASDDGSNSVEKVKARGYDSPVEDGELRVDTWQKNDVEEMECVDYESDNLDEDNSDAIESANNEVMEAVVPLPNNETEKHNKKNVPEHSQSAMSQEKDRNRSDCYSRGKRDAGQEKSTGRYYYQGRGNRWDEGWDSKRYPSSSSSSRAKHVIGERGSYTRPERNESSHYKGNIHDRYKGGYVQGPRREDYYSERRGSNYNRGAHRRRSRSRSKSRSRSWSEAPIAWNFQKKRNVDSKRESPHHHHHHHHNNNSNRADDVRLEEGQYRDRRDYNNNYNVGRLKSGDNSGRYPPQPSNSEYGMMNGEGRFRYNVKDNGFRYTRNQNSHSYLKQDSFRKNEFQRD